MEHSPALWWMKDGAGRYLFVNGTVGRFFNRSPVDFVGKTDFDFMSAETAQALRANDELVLQSQKTIHVHEILPGPDREHIFLIVKFPFHEQGSRYVGGIGFDVTDSRQAQVELERARDRALEAAALKSAFVSSVQHEIRTPLAGIIGMNELLLMSNLDEHQKVLATTVQESSEALLTVLNDILDLSKIQAGRLGLGQERLHLRLVADECIRLLLAAARNKRLQLSLSFDNRISDRLIGDAERLRQVLMNLLSNAIKFTATGSVELIIKLMSEDEGQATVRFSIRDTGIGIAKEKQSYLFMPFWQADMSDKRAYGGPGLGLPLSKHLIEKMGGHGITVESSPEKGSTFSFEIPFPKRESFEVQSKQAEVLIVEDNATLAAAIQKQLESLGIASQSTATCRDALSALTKHTFRLLLCERILQDGDAFDLLQQLRLHEGNQNVQRLPIVVMSSAPTVQERQHYLSIGADDYVSKPLTTEQLWRLVNIWKMI
jgi:two-component system sensor histidine kinase/response regulator